MSRLGRHRDQEVTPGTTVGTGVDAGRAATAAPTVTRSEERAVGGVESVEAGRVRVRKHVETRSAEQTVTREVEQVGATERTPAGEGDSGQVETLADGSISIPVFEEVLVVTKRLVVRERLIVRKETVVEEHTLQTDLRREHVTVEAEGDIEVVDNRLAPSPPVDPPPE